MPAARLFIVRYVPQVTSSIISRASKHTAHSTEFSERSGNVGLGHIHEVGHGGVHGKRRAGIQKPHRGGAEEVEHAGRNAFRKASSLRPSDLDRNRRYSMRVTITAAGRFLSEEDEILALGSPSTDHNGDDSPAEPSVQLPAGLASADDLLAAPERTGEYLGVPDGMLSGTPPTSHT